MDSAAAAPNPSTAEEEIAGTGQYKARCLNQADLPEVLKLLPPPPHPESRPSVPAFSPPPQIQSSEPCPKFSNQRGSTQRQEQTEPFAMVDRISKTSLTG